VTTAFGNLALRTDVGGASGPGPVMALVRPEQLVISTAGSGHGLRAAIVRTEFHGHDTVITVDPVSPAGSGPITVRAEGDLVLTDGTVVEITAAGSAVVWPAPAG
jgi:iron(III) transport system ATP-binding protein